jgi:outer membrane receptor protein involved in Fe transport
MTRRLGLLLCCAAFLSSSLLVTAPAPLAHADGVADEAELHFQLGAEAYRKGDFLGALEHFLASNRLAPNRNVMFNIARCYEQLGRFPDAYRYYVDALEGETDPEIKKAVEDAITRISPKVAVIEVTTTPPGATVYLDRQDLGSLGTTPARLGVAAGTYRVIVELPGHEPAEAKPIEVKAGTRTAVALSLEPVVGMVAVEGETGAEVRVDDEGATPSCTSPCTLRLPPGPHVLYFTRPGFAAVPRTVQVAARETVTVKASLVPLTGSLLVSADETNALIEIDGKPMGFTPSVIGGVPAGRHKVRVSLRGYQPIEREVEIQANTQTDLRDLELEPVREVAAASRVSEPVDDAPASITVISSAELEAFGYPTLLETLRGVRGFALTYDSTYGNASVRGLGQPNDFSNRLLVLGDGAVLNENVLYQPFIHYDGRVDLCDVDRIEIVRGPGSVLYGTGAVAGVINIVTRPRDEPTHVEATISTHDDAVARGHVGFQLRLGSRGGMWASLSGAHSDGRVEELRYDEDGDGRDEPHAVRGFDRFDAWSTAGRVWLGDFTAQWFWSDRDLAVPTGAYGSIVDRTDHENEDTRGLLELRYEPRVSPRVQLLGRAYANYAYYHSVFWYDAEADVNGMTVAFEQPFRETFTGAWAGGELRLVATPAPGLRLSVGAEVTRHFQVEMLNDQDEVDGSNTVVLDVSAPYSVLAGYASVEWRATPRLRLVGAARVDRWDLSQEATGLSGMPLTDDFTSVSPRVALIVRATPRDIIKVMGGRAFRAPSTYEYFYTDGYYTQATSDCCSETPLQPETVWSAEVEATHRFSRDWAVVGSAYGSVADGLITTVPVPEDVRIANDWPEGIGYYANSSVGQRALGLDVEVRREWRAGWMLSAQYGFLSARFLDSPQENDPDLAPGRRVPNQPQHFAGLRAVAPIVPDLVTGAVRLSLEAPRRIDLFSDDESDTAVITDVVLSGRVRKSRLRWSAGVYNLFNWRSELPATPYPSRLMPQGGRSVMFTLGIVR